MDYQNLFNQDFYPTPVEVIERMMSMSDVNGKIVLEPSAGKGDIVDWLKEHGAKSVICCEINNDLATVVGNKANLIASDFMTVTPDMVSHIDMIVMNPPFSQSLKHILHAYEVAPEGCEIIALCNDDTYRYRDTQDKDRLCELVDLYGNSEYIGQMFKTAERRTDVDVRLIRLYKPRTGAHEFDDFFDMTEDEAPNTAGIVQYSYVQDLVSKYKDAVEMFDDVMEHNKRINELCKSIGYPPIIFGARKANEDARWSENKITRDEFKKALQKSAWKQVFREFNMGKFVTRKVLEDLNRAIEIASDMPFTMKNIYKLVLNLVQTHGDRMQQTLVEAFDYICSLSAENSTAGEKWKTNSDYMINRRFIVPYMTEYRGWSCYRDYVELNTYGGDKIEDVVKALCYITGTNYDNMRSLSQFVREMNMEWGKWYYWGFFKIKGFKKGTMHFEFQDEDTWYKFNQAVAKVKGWQLPKQHKQKGK